MEVATLHQCFLKLNYLLPLLKKNQYLDVFLKRQTTELYLRASQTLASRGIWTSLGPRDSQEWYKGAPTFNVN